MKEDVKGKVEAIELKIDELERQRKELLEELGEGSLSWGMMIMGAFGALLTGLGIIAIFAAKWDAFGRETRAFIACLPVVVCGMTAVWAYAKRMTTRFLWEPLGIFWCLSLAAAVCLIDHTYGVGGSTPRLHWLARCLPWRRLRFWHGAACRTRRTCSTFPAD